MAGIRRLPTGKYWARVRVKGHPAQSKSFDRLTDARLWAQKTEADIRRGLAFPVPEGGKRTLADALTRYEAEVLPEKRATTQVPQRAQAAWWRARLGGHFLADITPAMLTDARAALLDEGKSLSTWNRYRALLTHVFTVAVREWGWTDKNPCASIQPSREPRGRIRFLSENEVRALLAACREHPHPHLHDVVLLALHTGARKDELLTLRWPCVDLARAQVRFLDTKNAEARTVPIIGRALDVLKERSRFRTLGNDLLFPAPTKPEVPCDIDRAFAQARDTAGLKDFRFHDLRHTAASYLAMAGCSLAEIGQVLGHKDSRVTARYAHLCDTHTRAVVDRLAQRLDGIIG
jgi:integrase